KRPACERTADVLATRFRSRLRTKLYGADTAIQARLALLSRIAPTVATGLQRADTSGQDSACDGTAIKQHKYLGRRNDSTVPFAPQPSITLRGGPKKIPVSNTDERGKRSGELVKQPGPSSLATDLRIGPAQRRRQYVDREGLRRYGVSSLL